MSPVRLRARAGCPRRAARLVAVLAVVVVGGVVVAPPLAAARVPWHRCGVRLQCARVSAPLNWARPHGTTISLAVIRHLASRPTKRIGSLFVNGGGASSSVGLVRTEGARLDALGRGRFDVVGWALRGGVGSEPTVRCFANPQAREQLWRGRSLPSTPTQARSYLRRTVAYARGCERRSGALLRFVSTADDARDLDYLRRLVGDRRLTYWAVSYGTFLGETYANMFPRRVRAMVFDGVVDPRTVVRGALARFTNTISAMDDGLRAFESLCQRAGPRRCALAGRGPVYRWVARLFTRLRHATIPAPDASPAEALSYGDLATVLFASVAAPAAWPRLAVDLRQAIAGNGSALKAQARAVLSGARSRAADAQTAIICSDSPARQGPGAWPQAIARLTRVSAWAGLFVGWSNWAPCASWPTRSADRYTGPWDRPTRTPLLLIGTRADPATPYVNARRVASLLGNAVLLTQDGYGHTSQADPSRCVQRATSAYLTGLVTPRVGAVCRSDHLPFGPVRRR